ncbi:unnamed protein product [Ectocarpus sp. 12 AP-2014]
MRTETAATTSSKTFGEISSLPSTRRGTRPRKIDDTHTGERHDQDTGGAGLTMMMMMTATTTTGLRSPPDARCYACHHMLRWHHLFLSQARNTSFVYFLRYVVCPALGSWYCFFPGLCCRCKIRQRCCCNVAAHNLSTIAHSSNFVPRAPHLWANCEEKRPLERQVVSGEGLSPVCMHEYLHDGPREVWVGVWARRGQRVTVIDGGVFAVLTTTNGRACCPAGFLLDVSCL